jgi:hypothetical protein
MCFFISSFIGDNPMKPLYLIACSEAKLDHSAPAADLYTGQAFRLAMAAAERAGADVIILSALHGAVSPSRELQPYNRSFADMNTQQRKVWAGMTDQQLQQHHGREITVLAGKHYAAAVEGWPNVSRPLAGFGIGQQLRALKYLNTTAAELEALEAQALADYRAEESDRRAAWTAGWDIGTGAVMLARARLGKIRDQLHELDHEGKREIEREARADYDQRAALMLDDA